MEVIELCDLLEFLGAYEEEQEIHSGFSCRLLLFSLELPLFYSVCVRFCTSSNSCLTLSFVSINRPLSKICLHTVCQPNGIFKLRTIVPSLKLLEFSKFE